MKRLHSEDTHTASFPATALQTENFNNICDKVFFLCMLKNVDNNNVFDGETKNKIKHLLLTYMWEKIIYKNINTNWHNGYIFIARTSKSDLCNELNKSLFSNKSQI